MNKIKSHFLSYGITMISSMKNINANWKVRLKKEWKESAKFPRKKKKAVRKLILREWNIACWNPLDED